MKEIQTFVSLDVRDDSWALVIGDVPWENSLHPDIVCLFSFPFVLLYLLDISTVVHCHHLLSFNTLFHFSHKIAQRNNRSSPFSSILFSPNSSFVAHFGSVSADSLPEDEKCHLYCVEKVTKGGTWLDIHSLLQTNGTNRVMSSSTFQFLHSSFSLSDGHKEACKKI